MNSFAESSFYDLHPEAQKLELETRIQTTNRAREKRKYDRVPHSSDKKSRLTSKQMQKKYNWEENKKRMLEKYGVVNPIWKQRQEDERS